MATFPVTEDALLISAPKKPHIQPKLAQKWGSVILEEHHFLRMLCLERKRSERSGNSFLLMLIRGKELFTQSRNVLSRIGRAIEVSTRETDTLGWYEQGSTLALLFTEIGSPELNTNLIVRKVRGALARVLSADELALIDMNVRVFPDKSENGGADDDGNADLVFYPDAWEQHDTKKLDRIFKRSIDVVGSLLILAILSPILLVVALLIKLTSEGPVLFRQKRVGQFGLAFTFLKFRSMYANNDSKVHQEYVTKLIKGKAELKQDGERKGGVYKLTNDPRVTPLGRFLRRTSLDELPQLFNVLIGNMSLVGPRPPVPYEYENYDVWHRRRVFEVKPGITGLWQVTGRSRTTFDEMVRLDLNYANAWSIWLDVKILLRTPMAVVSGDGAY